MNNFSSILYPQFDFSQAKLYSCSVPKCLANRRELLYALTAIASGEKAACYESGKAECPDRREANVVGNTKVMPGILDLLRWIGYD